MNNPPAFPHPPTEAMETPDSCAGMTLRDYFAASALMGISANPKLSDAGYTEVAEMSFEQADAMLRAREK